MTSVYKNKKKTNNTPANGNNIKLIKTIKLIFEKVLNIELILIINQILWYVIFVRDYNIDEAREILKSQDPNNLKIIPHV